MASFKINYKGGTTVLPFDYTCPECMEECVVEQSRRDDMSNRKCPKKKCKGILLRHIKTAPSLDPDYRQDQLTRNIGWDK